MAAQKQKPVKTELQKYLNLPFIIGSAVLCFYGLYLAIYIFKTSFLISGERYFCLTDDLMISMTYAKNFARGHGLVWNAGGEIVEGYSNPLWTLYMSLFHWLPVSLAKMPLFIQISGALFLTASLYYVRKIVLSITDSHVALYGALIFTMGYSHLIFWSLMGTEVSVLTFLVCVIVWKTIQYLRGESGHVQIYLLLGLATLVRVDMVMMLLCVWIFLLATNSERRKENLYYGAITTVVFIGGQTLFRLLYYGDILPNTYYLKMTGYPILLRIATGLYVFVKFAWGMNIIIFLLPFAVLYKKLKGNKTIAFLFVLVILQFLYSIYVGGDAWEERGGGNRFISIIMPLFFILFSYSLSQIILSRRLMIPVFAICILSFNFSALGEMFLVKTIFQVAFNEELVQRSKYVEKCTMPEASIALTSVGIVPYFSERRAIDQLGKCDRHIAHLKFSARYNLASIISYKPGHLKYDHDYIFQECKPDFVFQLPGLEREKAWKYLTASYIKFDFARTENFWHLRKDSKNIRWDILTTKEEE